MVDPYALVLAIPLCSIALYPLGMFCMLCSFYRMHPLDMARAALASALEQGGQWAWNEKSSKGLVRQGGRQKRKKKKRGKKGRRGRE